MKANVARTEQRKRKGLLCIGTEMYREETPFNPR